MKRNISNLQWAAPPLLFMFVLTAASFLHAVEDRASLEKEVKELRKQVAEAQTEYETQKQRYKKQQKVSAQTYLQTVKGAGENMERKIDYARASMDADEAEKAAKEKYLQLKKRLEILEEKLKVFDARAGALKSEDKKSWWKQLFS